MKNSIWIAVVVIGIGAVSVVAIVWSDTSARTVAPAAVLVEAPDRWAVVEECELDDSGLRRRSTATRRHVVSPEGTWYIVPKAYQEWANSIVEGNEVSLPKFIRQWDTTTLPHRNFSLQSREDMLSTITLLEGNWYQAATGRDMEGILFFAE